MKSATPAQASKRLTATEGVSMAATVLPESPDAFKDASWQEVVPFYEELAERPLDATNVEAWLADWSRFESLLSVAAALPNFSSTSNNAAPHRQTAQLRFGTESAPRAQ